MSQIVRFHKGNSTKIKESKVPNGWGLLKLNQLVEKDDMYFDKESGIWQKVEENMIRHVSSSNSLIIIRRYTFGCEMKPFDKDNRKIITLE